MSKTGNLQVTIDLKAFNAVTSQMVASMNRVIAAMQNLQVVFAALEKENRGDCTTLQDIVEILREE